MPSENPDYKLGQHDQAIYDIQSRVKNIEQKVEDLNVWRFKVVGVTSILAFILNFVGSQLFTFLQK
jgi:hypothetical protein